MEVPCSDSGIALYSLKMAGKKKHMTIFLHELEAGGFLGKTQKIVGRVFAGQEKTMASGKTIVTKYIVTGKLFADILYVEAWGHHGAKLAKSCVDGCVIELTGGIAIKEMDKNKKAWCATSANIYVGFNAQGAVAILSTDNDEYPTVFPCVSMKEFLDDDESVVHVECVLDHIEAPRTVKFPPSDTKGKSSLKSQGDGEDEKELQTAVVQGDGVKIGLELWGDSAGNLDNIKNGSAVRMENVRFKVKNNGDKMLVGNPDMKVTVLEGANAEEVIARSGVNKDFGQTGPDEDLTRVVTGRRKDGKTGPAKLISLNMVGAMLDAENPRSLGLDLYETYEFQIEQMSPLALDQQEWSYSGCSECNKKAGTCQHKGEPIPRFSMQAKLSDPTGCLMVKVFSNGVEGILNCTTAGKLLWSNTEADTEDNRTEIMKHLQNGAEYMGC